MGRSPRKTSPRNLAFFLLIDEDNLLVIRVDVTSPLSRRQAEARCQLIYYNYQFCY